VSSTRGKLAAGVQFEVHTFDIPHSLSRNAVRRMLTDQAEHGGWELARSRIFRDGRRTVTLRRKIIKANRTDEMVLQD
jgi:Family of unknown function (DUF5703)